VIELNKKFSSIKIAQMKAKNYAIKSIQLLWKNASNLFIHPEILDQFISTLVWSNQTLPSFVITRLSPSTLSSNVDTKKGSYLFKSRVQSHGLG
jgi:hypothetical protein